MILEETSKNIFLLKIFVPLHKLLAQSFISM